MGLLRLVLNLSKDDTALKLLFDHIRNIGIAALVFAAAAWKMQHIPWFAPPLAWIDVSASVVLLGLGLFLWIVNLWHGDDKLVAVGIPWLLWLYRSSHGLVSSAIVFSMMGGRLG
jgi:hypothetical protein